MDYLVQVVGHVLESRRPADFPKEVINALLIRAETSEELNDHINQHVNKFLRAGGMIAFKNPTDMQEVNERGELIGIDRRMFVPMTMLSHMDTITKPLASPLPDDGEGVLQ